jgi:hypothetical protein
LLKNFEILKNVNPYVEDPKIDKLYDYFVWSVLSNFL